MTLYQAMPQEHMALVKHLTAEVKTEEFIAGKGVVEKWERVRKNNHWLDTLYNASAAGHACGVRLVEVPVPAPQPARPPIQSHVWDGSRDLAYANFEPPRETYERLAG
jgi:hypothetical protein